MDMKEKIYRKMLRKYRKPFYANSTFNLIMDCMREAIKTEAFVKGEFIQVLIKILLRNSEQITLTDEENAIIHKYADEIPR
mgnify:CR=1 FL=1